MTTLYGIRNCNTVRKARGWLDAHGIEYAFHDYKAQGIDAITLGGWIERLGWGVLLNRAGTTFRKLPDEQKVDLDGVRAAELMLANPSTIKRPVLVSGETLLVGFSTDRYAEAFAV